MTLLDLAPYAGIVAAIGVALLLVARTDLPRVAGVALLLGGSLPLALLRIDSVGDLVADRAALVVAAFAIGAPAFVAATAVAVRWPWIVPVAALAAGLRVPMTPTPSPTDHLAPFWIVVAVGLAALAWRSLRGSQPPPRLGPVGWALAAYVLLAAVSLLWTDDLRRGAYVLVAFYLPLGGLAALVGCLDLTRRLREALVGGQLALATLFALVALYQWRAHDLFWNPTVIDANNYTPFFRVNSLFWDPAAFARFEALALITIVALFGLARSRRTLMAGGGLAALIFAGLVLSYSRSGLLMLIAGLVALAAAWRPRTAALAAAATVVGVVIAFGALTAAGALDATADRLTSDRLSLARSGVDEFREHPLAGVGLGSFGLAADNPDAVLGPHNVVVGVAAELGVLGLVALLALFVTVAGAIARPADRARDRTLRTLIAVELFAIFVQSLIDAGLFDDPLVWVFIAMLAVSAQPEVRGAEARAGPTAEPARA